MSVATNQERVLLRLLSALRPHWRRDAALPNRIQSLLAAERSFGSRDRRLYRELIYAVLRHLPWIEPLLDRSPPDAAQLAAWLAADTPATHNFRSELISRASVYRTPVGLPQSPPTSIPTRAAIVRTHFSIDPAPLLPPWFEDHCPAAFTPPEMEALLARAPLWLRLQGEGREDMEAEFNARGWTFIPSDLLRGALKLPPDASVTATAAFANGAFEVQDLGSQMVLESVGVERGASWLDACAGAGGKTLQLLQLLETGTVEACDPRPEALDELALRAKRSKVRRASVHRTPVGRPPRLTILPLPPPPDRLYDGVLVDAPCSGSGTWRRSPHLKWTTTPAAIESAARLQLELVQRYSRHVKPGGRLVYATCSLSRMENEEVVKRFLASAPSFKPEPPKKTFGFTPQEHGMTILPARHDTDGFFVSCLRNM